MLIVQTAQVSSVLAEDIGKKHALARKRSLLTRSSLYLSAAIAVFLTLFLIVNLHDPDLDPGAVAAIRATMPSVPDAENAYFVLHGIGVAEGQDPHAQGLRFVLANNAWIESRNAGQLTGGGEPEVMEVSEAVPWLGGTGQDLCGEPRMSCLAAYIQNRPLIEKFVHNNGLRLARYRSLYRYRYFRETLLNRAASALPDLAVPEHETVLAQIGLKATEGSVSAALRDLSDDTAYWRRVLAGSNSLVLKIAAAKSLSRNYALGAEIVGRYHDRPGVLAADLSIMTQPLMEEEKDWKGILTSEFQWRANACASLDVGPGFTCEDSLWNRMLVTVFYKPNATINRHYGYHEKVQLLADMPAYALRGAAQRIDRDFAGIANPGSLDMLYNPIGKAAVALAVAPPGVYALHFAHVHNLDGYVRLLGLQLDIYRARVAVGDVETYLETSHEHLFDPYRAEPMRWDRFNSELWFEGIDPASTRNEPAALRIAVRV